MYYGTFRSEERRSNSVLNGKSGIDDEDIRVIRRLLLNTNDWLIEAASRMTVQADGKKPAIINRKSCVCIDGVPFPFLQRVPLWLIEFANYFAKAANFHYLLEED